MSGSARRRVLLSLAAVTAVASCGDDPKGEAEGVETWAVEEFRRLGSIGDPHTSFADVADILATESGVFVLEWGQPRVAAFNAEGAWLRDFAGPGDGPGELRMPQSLGLTEGHLWIQDPRGSRLETYSLDGEPRESFRFTLLSDSLAPALSAHAVLEDGTLLAGPSARLIGAEVSGRTRYADYAKVDRQGELQRRLYRAEYGVGDAFAADIGGGRQLIGIHPIRHSPLVEPFPDGSGLVVVERFIADDPGEDVFRLLVLDANGEPLVDASVPYMPVRAEGWKERHIQRLRESAQGGGDSDPMIRGLREGLPERSFYPPVSELVAGADGTIWLRREPIDATRADWEVYDRFGAKLGVVTLPADLKLRHASQDELWGIEMDELDVPFVVGLRVVQ